VDLAALSEEIDPLQDIDLAYYPLAGALVHRILLPQMNRQAH
jgi:hypothetical protein